MDEQWMDRWITDRLPDRQPEYIMPPPPVVGRGIKTTEQRKMKSSHDKAVKSVTHKLSTRLDNENEYLVTTYLYLRHHEMHEQSSLTSAALPVSILE